MARESRGTEKEDEYHEACDEIPRNYSSRLHRSEDLTAEGRSGRAVGRARSPVLNARAVAAVKIADCVSWPTLRADVKFRCALTISG